MELNRELSQQSWLEVKHFVLADSFGCEEIHLVLSSLTSTSVALRALTARLGAKASEN